MTRLEYPAYLTAIRRESARFRDVLAGCDPTSRVPSCPEWTAADLVWHLTGVQHRWHALVVHRPQKPDEIEYVAPARPEGYDALLAAFDEAHAAFVAALEGADPGDAAYSWAGDPAHHTVGFTYRRQAHEALIHRLDAELTSGDVTPLDPALAADGVEEVLDVMYGHLPPWGTFEPLPHHLEFRLSDAGTSVWTRIGTFSGTAPDGREHVREKDMHVVADPGVPADAVVTGEAGAMDAWLWQRRDEAGITVTGDQAVIDHARELLANPTD